MMKVQLEQFLQRIHPNCCGFELIVAHSDAIIITVHYTDMSHVYVLHIGITVLSFRSGFAAHTEPFGRVMGWLIRKPQRVFT